jgi:hypothetical protein
LRLGHLHLQKCAGTALNTAIAFALNQEPLALLSVQRTDKTEPPLHHPQEHVALFTQRRAWQSAPFIAGHISIEDLRFLKREFIFTCLRRPRERLLSHYAYWYSVAQQAPDPKRLPSYLSKITELSFDEYLYGQELDNVMARQLGGNSLNDDLRQDSAAHRDGALESRLRQRLDMLTRLYVGVGPDNIVEDLHRLGLLPSIPAVPKLNETRPGGDARVCITRHTEELVGRRTWADNLVWEMASAASHAVVDRARGAERDGEPAAVSLRRYGFVVDEE